jgi:hypothetical protein
MDQPNRFRSRLRHEIMGYHVSTTYWPIQKTHLFELGCLIFRFCIPCKLDRLSSYNKLLSFVQQNILHMTYDNLESHRQSITSTTASLEKGILM